MQDDSNSNSNTQMSNNDDNNNHPFALSRTFCSPDGAGLRGCVALVDDATNDTTNSTTNDASRTSSIVCGNQLGGLIGFGFLSDKQDESNANNNIQLIEFQHDHSVTALVSYCYDDNKQYYITACKDGHIRLFDSISNKLLHTFKGHEKAVTSLSISVTNVSLTDHQYYLCSGSWDGTAKLWNLNNKSLIATLPNHENSVCVAILPSQNNKIVKIATGSAGIATNNVIRDHSVRLWNIDLQNNNQTQLLHTVSNDHDGPIRDICYYDNAIYTCSNDGTVKMRDMQTGTCLGTLSFATSDHPPMLLSLAVCESFIAAGAEDGHVIVWNNSAAGGSGGSDPQILRHPQCVWHVSVLPTNDSSNNDNDLLTCSQDGSLRIFTRDTHRYASAADRQAFEEAVQAQLQKTSQGPTPDEIAKLPHWYDNARHVGSSEGHVQVFQKDGVAIAAQWSAASRTWIEVGQVMGQSHDSSSTTIDGVSYDHVFPIQVDVSAGNTADLQIGYNNGENPFVAAQRFMDRHQLPQYHLAEIADYISQRAGRPQPVLGQEMPAGNTTTTTPTTVLYDHLPVKSYKSFGLVDKTAATTLQKMKAKLQEFHHWADDAPQLATISSLMDTLAATSRYHSSKISDAELKAIVDGFTSNDDPNTLFPMLDLARLTVTHPHAASATRSAFWDGMIQQAILVCQDTSTQLQGPAVIANPMLTLRLFCNAFGSGPGSRSAVALYLNELLQCVQVHATTATNNKTVRLSAATVLFNVAFFLFQNNNPSASVKPDASIGPKLVHIVDSILTSTNTTYETEALYRVLVALGTVLLVSKEAKQAARDVFLASRVEPAASPHSDACKAVAKEVYSLLQ